LALSFARRGDFEGSLANIAKSADNSELSPERVIATSFSSGLTDTVVHVTDTHLTDRNNLDCHDAATARLHPMRLQESLETCASILDTLKKTEGRLPGNSLLDETTVMILSEFGRTMRQANVSIEQSGTDHNPLNNQIFLIGRGIRGGQLCGESDIQSTSDFENLPENRTVLDPLKIKTIGLACDFDTGLPIRDLPYTVALEGRIRMRSVLRTFGLAAGREFPIDNGAAGDLPPLRAILR
jgi:hypothetical protein